MNLILVFQNGELLKQINCKTKKQAEKQVTYFKKHGLLDPNTGEVIENCTFELI